MKNVLKVLIVAAFVAAFALPALAQDTAATPAPAQQQRTTTTTTTAPEQKTNGAERPRRVTDRP